MNLESLYERFGFVCNGNSKVEGKYRGEICRRENERTSERKCSGVNDFNLSLTVCKLTWWCEAVHSSPQVSACQLSLSESVARQLTDHQRLFDDRAPPSPPHALACFQNSVYMCTSVHAVVDGGIRSGYGSV